MLDIDNEIAATSYDTAVAVNLRKLKVLWVGDAAVSTGFSRCSHTVLDHLHANGDRVAALGINYFGDPHPYPYPIFPCRQPVDGGYDAFGVTRLPHLVARLRPDVVVLLQDPWNVPAYIAQLKQDLPDSVPMPKLVGWIAVDGLNQDGTQLNDLDLVIVWTEFARAELVRGGCVVPIELAPLGVDTDIFYPRDRLASRLAVLPPGVDVETANIIGVVGRDQPRKRLDLTIRSFAEYVNSGYYHGGDNAYLYLHVAPTGEAGTNIKSLVKYYGVEKRVIITNGLTVGTGVTDDYMAQLYSAFDVYLSTSQGEGWGLPSLESMACGTRCVLPNWSAYGDWAKGIAELVPCTDVALTAPLNDRAYTLGGVVDPVDVAHSLEWVTLNGGTEIERGLALARRLSWQNTATQFSLAFDRHIRYPPLPG